MIDRTIRPTLLSSAIIFLGLVVVGCNKSPLGSTENKTSEIEISGDTYKVDFVPWSTNTRCQGSLVADETTTLSAKVAGRVENVFVDVGDLVDPEKILVQLDPTDFKLLAEQADAQLQQARAAVGLKPGDPVENLNPEKAPPVQEAKAMLDEATQALARMTSLASEDAITQSDLELAESAERVAKARYQSSLNSVREKIALISVQSAQRDLAHEQLRETKVSSPFEGTVQSRSVSPGTFVQAGQALLSVVRTKQLRFRTSVPERYAHLLKIGQRIAIHFDLSDQVREGTVSRINPNLDPSNRSLGFEVDIDNSDGRLRSGLFGEAVLELDPEAKAIAVPEKSILRFAGVDKVWKIKDGQVIEGVVLLGQKRGDMIEVKSGLQAGEIILQEAARGEKGKWVGDAITNK